MRHIILITISALAFFTGSSPAENPTRSDWQKALADYTAAGGSLDLKDFTAAAIPDDQNYAAAAFLKGITIPDDFAHPSGLDGKSVRAPFDEMSTLLEMPDIDEKLFDEWVENGDPRKPLPLRFWVKLLSQNAGRPLKIDLPTATDAQIADEILTVIDSKFGRLLTASDRAALRPKSTWVPPTTDFYDLENPNEGTINHANSAIVFSRLLRLRARAAAHADKPEIAARSIDAILHLARSERPFPRAMIQFLVSTTLNRIAQSALQECLATRVFDDVTLTHFTSRFSSVNAIEDCAQSFRAEMIFTANFTVPLDRKSPEEIAKLLTPLLELDIFETTETEIEAARAEIVKQIENLESGTFQRLGTFIITQIPRTAIVPLEKGEIQKFKRLQADLAGRITEISDDTDTSALSFATGLSSLVIYSTVGKSAVKLEAESRMGQIACALERHHLENGTYPDALEDLSPKFLKSIPNDPVNSKPLRYLRLGKNYRLYSVAWDSIDHGGKPEHPSNPDDRGHDWVWPRFELQPKSP